MREYRKHLCERKVSWVNPFLGGIKGSIKGSIDKKFDITLEWPILNDKPNFLMV